MPRIAIGEIKQESNSFSPVNGGWAHFRDGGYLLRGREMIDRLRGTACEIGGALEISDRNPGFELFPLLAAQAGASAGPLKRSVFDAMLSELLDGLNHASPLDGVFVCLHGATVVENLEDACGEVLRSVRKAIGPDTPLVSTCDLHANVTPLMADSATAIVGYQTSPHVDLDRAGRRAMEILLGTISEGLRPTAALCRLPMILPGETSVTIEGPLAEVIQEIKAVENFPEILSASAFAVQPWLDLSDVGCSVLVVSDGDSSLARSQAERIADLFWERRDRFQVRLTPLADTISLASRGDGGPYVVSDAPDAPSSGSTGDSTEILKALLDSRFDRTAFLNVVDPVVVEQAIEAGIGATINVDVGGKLAPDFFSPARISGYVRTISDGNFIHKGAGYRGVEFQRGRTVVLQSGSISLVVTERPVIQWDLQFYRSLGLEPTDARMVVLKSPQGFRAEYSRFAEAILFPDVRGICSSHLASMPWKRIGRPIYPMDEPRDWRIPPIGCVHIQEKNRLMCR